MIGQRKRKMLIAIRRNKQLRRIHINARNMSGGKISFGKIWKGIKKVYSHGKKIYENPAVQKLIDIGTNVLRTRYPKKMAKVEGMVKKAKKTYRLGDRVVNRGREIMRTGVPVMSDIDLGKEVFNEARSLGRDAYNGAQSYWGSGTEGGAIWKPNPITNLYNSNQVWPHKLMPYKTIRRKAKGSGLTKYKKRKSNLKALKSVSELRNILASVR